MVDRVREHLGDAVGRGGDLVSGEHAHAGDKALGQGKVFCRHSALPITSRQSSFTPIVTMMAALSKESPQERLRCMPSTSTWG